MIRRTNPWIGGGSNGDVPPPRSPAYQTPLTSPMRCRRCSADDETGKEEEAPCNVTIGTTKPLRNSIAKLFVDEESNVFSFSPVVCSGDDSLLTTSMETDSLLQSEISDNEPTRTSHLDLNLTPNDNERRPNDDVTPYADSPVEKDVSISRTRLSSACFGRHKDTVTDHQSNRPSIEAVVNSEERNRKRLRRSPESNTDWERPTPCSSVDEEESGQISELFPCRKSQATTERRTMTTTTPTKIHNDDDETHEKPKCQQRRQRLVRESGKTDFIGRYDEDPLTASDQLRRKILAIRSSLQDKVTLLKHEKKVVDRKIREAKEEERLRLRQLELFRQQLSQTRKEILLRTLEEVKKQLNQQVLRLQNVYDFVLVEQRQLVCCY